MDRHDSPSEPGPETAYESPTFDKDVQIRVNETVGSASISPSGRDVVLASREGLHIIDLDSPFSPPRYVPHRSPWEVADVQWSPFASRDSWIVSTSNQKALVWNLNLITSSAPIEHTLHAHSNAITDINFSAIHPDILATCAVDSYVHCWDLRRPAKPVISFAEWFSGATQVKWNRQDSHILASSHQRKLLIWDDRKGAYPLREIEAHSTQIYGLDWNRLRPEAILTCSLDRSIKLWDYTKPDDVPETVIRTPYPVWRARHTPFGRGILAMPKRHDFDLHMYDRRPDANPRNIKELPPVHSFGGHTDQVKEFLWRSRGGIQDNTDAREFQLVSWGTDRYLRLHKISPDQLHLVGHRKGTEVHKRLNLTRAGSAYRTFRDDVPRSENVRYPLGLRPPRPSGLLGLSISQAGMGKAALNTISAATPAGMQAKRRTQRPGNAIDWMGGVKMGKATEGGLLGLAARNSIRDHQVVWDTPDSLSDEITYVGQKFKKVNFERVDINRRSATVTLNGPWGAEGASVFVRVTFKFPASYPVHATPQYAFEKTTSAISDSVLATIKHGLRTISEYFGMRRCGSLEALITYLLGERALEESLNAFPDAGTAADESSSDDDAEDEDAGDMNMSGSLGSALANASVPLPKECGAYFAEDGRLVCFFPPKPEPKPLFDLGALRTGDKSSRGHRFFEDFGRWQSDSPEPNERSSDVETDDESGSSEESFSSSASSSSETSDIVSGLPRRFMPPAAWRGATIRLQKSSQHSSAGYAQQARTVTPKSYISIVDTRDLLPAKKELAEEYVMYGDGPSVCAHNAAVAARHDAAELAQVWELIRLILFNRVPLELLPQDHRKEPILSVARRVITRVRKKDSAIDLSADNEDHLMGRVKWANHPLARGWLVPQLFEHFEKLADIQMLAMMSCVLAEPAASQSVAHALIRLNQPDLPISMKIPALSLPYFHSEEVARSLLNPRTDPVAISQNGAPPFSWNGHTQGVYGSAGSSNGHWSNDVPFMSSANSTPPKLARSQTMRLNYPHSLSTSPERHLALRRTGTSLFAGSLALPRPFTLTAPGSPPGPHFRNDEADLSTSAPASAVTWGETTVYSGSGTANNSPTFQRKSRASSMAGKTLDEFEHSDSDSSVSSEDEQVDVRSHMSRPRTSFDTAPRSASVSIKVTLSNQDAFEEEARANVPLLDPADAAVHAAYRAAYAEQLSVWQLPIARSEVLKFNGMESSWPGERGDEGGKRARGSQGTLGRERVAFQKLQEPVREDAAGEQHCRICWQLLDGLYIHCDECEVGKAHKECVEQWFEDLGGEEPWCDIRHV